MSGKRFGGARTEAEPWYTSSPYEPSLPPVTKLSEVDLLDQALYHRGDPHAVWRLLRREAPVFWHERGAAGTEGKGFWVFTRYDDMIRIYREQEIFSSWDGPFLDLGTDATPGKMLASIDGDMHRTNRRVVARFFTPAALRKWAASIRATVNRLLDAAAAKPDADFLKDIAGVLPVIATCDLLGVAPAEAEVLAGLLSSAEPNSPESLKRFNDATLAFFEDLATERRRGRDGESIAAIVANAEKDGGPMPEDEISHLLWNLFFGGIDSTAHAASGALLALFHHDDQRHLLQQNPSLINDGIDELFRWTSISHTNKRKVLQDVVMHDTLIRAGDYVTMWSPSGNRDETAFADPYRFDLTRRMRKPIVAFGGGGAHQCLGQFFARLELQILFEELFRRFPNIEQAGPAVRANHFTIITAAFEALPIHLGSEVRALAA